MTEFKIDDHVVYPGQGIGRIVAVEERIYGGTSVPVYIITILGSGARCEVPTMKSKTIGLRGIIPSKDVMRFYKILQKRRIPLDNQAWNRRYRDYMGKIKTGSVYEIAEVLRDLFHLQSDKDLSFGEKKMLDTAKTLLVKEISLAKGELEDSVEQELRSMIGV